MKHNIRILSIFMLSVLALSAYATEQRAVERYALYIGSNNGGKDREILRYAASDAQKLAQTMEDVGGVKPKNSMILIEPDAQDVLNAFNRFAQIIERDKTLARRTEFVFYYSGHSDETSLLLGPDSFDYTKLKQELNKIPSDVHVVMLDSCYSGNFIRTKGGTKDKPFLLDDSSVVQGHAYLSSSSDTEASQESDALQASFFTHSLITGLRGAADSSGDNKVSLNELYYYTFNHTLAKTESTYAGPQHPSFNITLVGSGDLVLTDISDADSLLIIPANFEGATFIRNSANVLVSEINKTKGNEIALALPAGTYSVTIITPTYTTQSTAYLAQGSRVELQESAFRSMLRTLTRTRGGELIEDEFLEYKYNDEAYESGDFENTNGSSGALTNSTSDLNNQNQFPPHDAPWEPFSFTLFPGFRYPTSNPQYVQVSLGAFMAIDQHIDGMQASSFMNITNKSFSGVQATGFMNITRGPFDGIQAAGFMNIIRGSTDGAQGSGFMNVVQGSFDGIQGSGFMNITQNSFSGIQGAGFMNVTSGFFEGIQGAGFMNHANKGFDGIQGTGFLNNAGGSSTGLQVAGFINIASSIKGVQIAPINIAINNTGATIGILNFVVNGIISPAVFQDTNDIFYIQYQGGTKHFFTTLLLGTPSNWGNEWDFDLWYAGFGIGHRFILSSSFSMDLELLSKLVIDSTRVKMTGDLVESKIKDTELTDEEYVELSKDILELFEGKTIPTVRFTANVQLFPRLNIFGSYNMDLKITGYNEQAFEKGRHQNSYTLFKENIQVHPSFSFGIKF